MYIGIRRYKEEKSMKKLSTIIAILTTTTFLPPGYVFAANTPTPVFGHHMQGGISNIYTYIDTAQTPAASYWQNFIIAAINNWMYTGVGANNFYNLGYVSSGTNGSKLDFYGKYGSYWGNNANDILAETKFYSYSITQVYPDQSDWYSGEVLINHTLMSSDSVSDWTAHGTFRHEIGHVFGLAHNNSNPNSIMCQTSAGRAVNTIQAVDNNALNSLYPL